MVGLGVAVGLGVREAILAGVGVGVGLPVAAGARVEVAVGAGVAADAPVGPGIPADPGVDWAAVEVAAVVGEALATTCGMEPSAADRNLVGPGKVVVAIPPDMRDGPPARAGFERKRVPSTSVPAATAAARLRTWPAWGSDAAVGAREGRNWDSRVHGVPFREAMRVSPSAARPTPSRGVPKALRPRVAPGLPVRSSRQQRTGGRIGRSTDPRVEPTRRSS